MFKWGRPSRNRSPCHCFWNPFLRNCRNGHPEQIPFFRCSRKPPSPLRHHEGRVWKQSCLAFFCICPFTVYPCIVWSFSRCPLPFRQGKWPLKSFRCKRRAGWTLSAQRQKDNGIKLLVYGREARNVKGSFPMRFWGVTGNRPFWGQPKRMIWLTWASLRGGRVRSGRLPFRQPFLKPCEHILINLFAVYFV